MKQTLSQTQRIILLREALSLFRSVQNRSFFVTCGNYRSTRHEALLHNNISLPVRAENQTLDSSSLSRVAPVCGSFKVPTGGAVSCMSRFCAANIPSALPPLGHHCYRRHHQNTWQHCSTGKKGKQVTPSTFLRPQLLPL